MRLILAALLGGFLFSASSVAAQTLCGQRENVLRGLTGTYTETPSAMGLSNNGGVVEILTSPKGDTWTIIITMPNGLSCLIAAGENWEKMPNRPESREESY